MAKRRRRRTTTTKTTADWADEYGIQAALVNSDPGLKTLFDRAVAQKWTAQKFNAELQNTDWYKNNAQSWREAETARLSQPGTWKQSIDDLSEQIRQTAASMGISIDDANVAKLADQTAHSSWGKGVDPNILRSHIVEYGKITGSGGESAQIMNTLKNYAYSMGVKYDSSWYESQAQNILSGKATVDDSYSTVNQIAKSKYSAFADQIDAGMKVDQIASPYINSMASILEIDPANITLDDNTINRALTNVNQDGKQAPTPLWQFETQLRQDPRWATTQNARQTVDTTARSILQSFGLVS